MLAPARRMLDRWLFQLKDKEPGEVRPPGVRGVGEWICRLDVDWAAGEIAWTPLCRNGSSWDSQDSHPHPIFNHAADAIYFTSDLDGKRAVYKIDIG